MAEYSYLEFPASGRKRLRAREPEELADRAGESARFVGLEPDKAKKEREASWEDRLSEIAYRAKIDLSRLPPKKSDPDKALLAAVMKRRTSVSNRWPAERLGVGEPASASQFARRLGLTTEGARRIGAILSKVKV